MTNYIEFYRRALTFKKYPLFRTVNFKQLLLNIVLINLLLILPSAIMLLGTVQHFGNVLDVQDQVPDFQIVDGEYQGDDAVVDIGDNQFVFSESLSTNDVIQLEDNVFAAFLKDGLYIRDIPNDSLDYAYIGTMTDRNSLVEFISQQLSSLYFYYFVYLSFQFVLMTFVSMIALSIIIYLLHVISLITKKKSRFMNWFKFSTFIVIILLIPYVLIEILFEIKATWIALVSIPFIIYYYLKQPVHKNKKI